MQPEEAKFSFKMRMNMPLEQSIETVQKALKKSGLSRTECMKSQIKAMIHHITGPYGDDCYAYVNVQFVTDGDCATRLHCLVAGDVDMLDSLIPNLEEVATYVQDDC
jgi:hypothetical protein